MQKNWAGNQAFTLDPIEAIHFSGFTGLKYSMTTTLGVNEGTSYRSPKPVHWKETFIYFDTPDGPFLIEYSAPIGFYDFIPNTMAHTDYNKRTPADLYEKYKPQLEHLLNTFRWIEDVKETK